LKNVTNETIINLFATQSAVAVETRLVQSCQALNLSCFICDILLYFSATKAI